MKTAITADFRRDTVVPIVRHEIGHRVVAAGFGFDVGVIKVNILHWNEHHACAEIMLGRKIPGADEAIKYLRERIKVLYAGVLAETLKDGEIDNDAALAKTKVDSAVRDCDKARELVHLLRSMTFATMESEEEMQTQLAELNSDLWNAAAALVKKNAGVIQNLAEHIAAKIQFFGERSVTTTAEIEAFVAGK
jgi:hypothetical protein